MSKQLPLHTHDCDCCIFLGRHSDKNFPEELDLYFCPSQSYTPTVIARYDSEPSAYLSNLIVAKYYVADYKKSHENSELSTIEILRSAKPNASSTLLEAAARAIEAGLIDENLSSASTARYRP